MDSKGSAFSGSRAAPWPSFLLAALVGIAWTLLLMPVDTIAGGGPLWAHPNGDNAQALAGNLAFQRDAWRLPLLFTHAMFWPGGLSVAMSDSNSLFALLGKLAAGFTGHPVNLLGLWWALCWALQPVAAVYALRCLGVRDLIPCLAAAALAAMTPALLFRVHHINLCGHFFLLATLGLTASLLRQQTPRRWTAAAALLAGAILCHPYLFAFAAATLAAVPLQRALDGWRTAAPTALRFLAATAAPMLMFGLLSGSYGGGDHGFALFSMNLASPIWPQHSGLFGADLPILDATGGQGEGFNYLGAGTLLLAAAALLTRHPRRIVGSLRPWRGLLIVCLGLTLIALSSRIYLGPIRILNLGLKPWEDIFAPIRSSGRAFWPVGYAIMLAGVLAASRLPPRLGWPLLVLAVGLQWIDIGPFRRGVQALMAHGAPTTPVPALPAGGRLLTMVPAPGCGPNTRESNLLLLAGVRAGMDLGDIGVGRPPRWFNCEKLLSDSAERPLLPGELRAFTADKRPLVRQELMGPDAICAISESVAICGTPAAPPLGTPIDLRHTLAPLGPDIAPLLSFGWSLDGAGLAWSEGPRATLAFLPPPGTHRIALVITAVADRPGGTRPVTITDATGASLEADLPDAQQKTITLDIQPGPIWLAFDVVRPIDPARRNLAAPVNRAALRLIAVAPAP